VTLFAGRRPVHFPADILPHIVPGGASRNMIRQNTTRYFLTASARPRVSQKNQSENDREEACA
jgi:hypothetical protein